MKQNKIKKYIIGVLVVVLTLGIMKGLLFHPKEELQITQVISTIDNYNYELDNRATKLYQDYFKELKNELSTNKIDEKNYAILVAKLFTIDYYTLNNKVTNQNIGGVQFIHSTLQDKFIKESKETVYKYVKNNLYGNRKQNLPEVTKIKLGEMNRIVYDKDNYYDDSSYEIMLRLDYKVDYGYPKEVTITLIHEDNKLVIVKIR